MDLQKEEVGHLCIRVYDFNKKRKTVVARLKVKLMSSRVPNTILGILDPCPNLPLVFKQKQKMDQVYL